MPRDSRLKNVFSYAQTYIRSHKKTLFVYHEASSKRAFRAFSKRVGTRTLRDINFRAEILLSEPSIENYDISNELSTELSNVSLKPIQEHRRYLDVIVN